MNWGTFAKDQLTLSQFPKLRPVGSCAADLLAIHALASGGLQLGDLAGEVLGVGRDAGIAVIQARRYATEVVNSIKGIRSLQKKILINAQADRALLNRPQQTTLMIFQRS